MIKSLVRNRYTSTIPTIVILNIIVYIQWFFASTQSKSQLLFMYNNFLVSWTGLLDGRLWTLVTSTFSHNMFWHLFINMYVLINFGLILEKILGPKEFLQFYLLAGTLSSLSHALVSYLILGEPSIPALGASGAISGLILLFSLMFPKEKILLFGIIPLPAIVGSLAFVGLDIWGLVAQAEGGGLPIGHGAHLGGAVVGVIYYLLSIRPRLIRSRY